MGDTEHVAGDIQSGRDCRDGILRTPIRVRIEWHGILSGRDCRGSSKASEVEGIAGKIVTRTVDGIP
jgi:hypothetical protein